MSDSLENFTAAGANSYSQYEQDHSYEYDNGLAVLPVAGRAPKHRIIRLHGGLGMRKVNWHATRAGKPPIVPTMEDTPFDTFVGGTVVATLPQPNPQALGYNWAVSGTYLFVQDTPRVVGTDTIPTGGFPYPIVPNDAAANNILANQAATFIAANDGVQNPYDAVAQAVAETVDHDTESYLWPFTMLPPVFTNSTLIGA